jgi:hypothetical protein
MNRQELIQKLSEAIAEMEGFYITEAQAKARKIPYPTLAQRNSNPGNIRRWRRLGKPYPVSNNFVDFKAWAKETFPGMDASNLEQAAINEGWRILKILVGQYIDGLYTGGRPPTFEEMFRIYAPAADKNNPQKYADFVAKKLGASPEQVIRSLVV